MLLPTVLKIGRRQLSEKSELKLWEAIDQKDVFKFREEREIIKMVHSHSIGIAFDISFLVRSLLL
jgi:hypothetical protein